MNGREGGLLAAWLKVPIEAEDEFHDWYNLEHLAQIGGLPGFRGGRRYEPISGDERWFLALYGLEDVAVIAGPHFQRAINEPSPWSLRMRKHYGPNRIRNVYRCLADEGDPAVAPFVAVLRWDRPPQSPVGYEDRLAHELVPALATVPGCLRARGLFAVEGGPPYAVVCDLAAADVIDSAPWRALDRPELSAPVVYRLLRATDSA